MSMLSYRKIFDPADVDVDPELAADTEPMDDQIYVFGNDHDEDTAVNQIVLAINAAIVTRRPLLVYGPPGSGKSSLASNIARVLGIPFHERVIDSRTEVRDLLWRFDAVRRLSDSRLEGGVKEDRHYIEQGVLWDAFASRHPREQENIDEPSCVVLLDEIDKADPDLPNGLLGPLGSFSFRGPGAGEWIKPNGNPPLVVITSNNERELSRPFLRRCIALTLQPPTKSHLVKVAAARFGDSNVEVHRKIADFVVDAVREAEDRRLPAPSTAEYLDAVRSCERLGIPTEGLLWDVLARVVLKKSEMLT